MITLYHGGGAADFEILGDVLDKQDHEVLMLNVRQILRARGAVMALESLERATFLVKVGTNYFNDEFHVLLAEVPLHDYEGFRKVMDQAGVRNAFRQIAEVVTEIGPHIRFIAVDLKISSPESWEVFICYASEDKATVVEPLFRHLTSTGIRCWYDRGEILWGDSIVAKISEGLACSRFVIVVVSNSLLGKRWATKEMNAALSQEIDSGTTRLLPLMVGSDQQVEQIRSELAIQRDKRYLRWSENPEEIEAELRLLIRRENIRGKV